MMMIKEQRLSQNANVKIMRSWAAGKRNYGHCLHFPSLRGLFLRGVLSFCREEQSPGLLRQLQFWAFICCRLSAQLVRKAFRSVWTTCQDDPLTNRESNKQVLFFSPQPAALHLRLHLQLPIPAYWYANFLFRMDFLLIFALGSNLAFYITCKIARK